eukprot:1192834-Prorocentrum_minimum.AAC.2
MHSTPQGPFGTAGYFGKCRGTAGEFRKRQGISGNGRVFQGTAGNFRSESKRCRHLHGRLLPKCLSPLRRLRGGGLLLLEGGLAPLRAPLLRTPLLRRVVAPLERGLLRLSLCRRRLLRRRRLPSRLEGGLTLLGGVLVPLEGGLLLQIRGGLRIHPLLHRHWRLLVLPLKGGLLLERPPLLGRFGRRGPLLRRVVPPLEGGLLDGGLLLLRRGDLLLQTGGLLLVDGLLLEGDLSGLEVVHSGRGLLLDWSVLLDSRLLLLRGRGLVGRVVAALEGGLVVDGHHLALLFDGGLLLRLVRGVLLERGLLLTGVLRERIACERGSAVRLMLRRWSHRADGPRFGLLLGRGTVR